MKKYFLTIISIILFLAAVLMLTPIGERCATLLTLTPASELACLQFPDAYNEGEQLLKHGKTEGVRQIIEDGKAQAKDSNEYYRFEVLNIKYYYYTMQTDSFMACHKRIRNYIARNSHKRDAHLSLLELECEMQMGVYETKVTGRMDSAQVHNMKALEMAKRLGCDDDYRLLILINIAEVYKQQGRYDQSVTYYREAMELGDSAGMFYATRITLDIGIASAYAAMGNFDQSNDWWEQAAQLKQHMDITELFHYLNNRGNDYYLQGKYRESLECFLELDSTIANDPNLLWERMFERCNLSDVYIKLGHIDQGKAILDETQPFFTEQQQPIPLFYLITQRIEVALEEGRIADAERLAKENPIPEWMIPSQKQLRRKVLMRLYERTGQWQKYSQQLNEYMLLHDSIANDNTKMRFSEALMHYEHEKTLLQKQRQLEEKEQSFRWAVALLLLSSLIIVLLIIITVLKHRERQLREAEMRNSIAKLRMKTVRNRITPHFISNALAAEIMAQMDGKEVNLDSLVQLLHRGIEHTDIEQSSLSEELEFIRFYCSIESHSVGPDFCLSINVPEGLDTDSVRLPSMAVQILVENAIKHGLKARRPEPGKKRCVWVNVKPQEEATLIEVIDNGVGLAEERQNKERTGLRVMRQTINLLNDQYTQTHGRRTGKPLMDYGLDNYTHPDGQRGCRAWLLLPNDFDYILKNQDDKDTPHEHKINVLR